MEIPIHLAVEDSLSDAVVRFILRQSSRRFAIGTSYMRGGFSYLKKSIAGYNVAAKGTSVITQNRPLMIT